ncbi:MAG: hypothetical protein ACP5I7_06785 [Sulfolobales archaeon]
MIMSEISVEAVCMPFTTYHLASGLLIGLVLRKWIHLPTFLVTTTLLVDLGSGLLILSRVDTRPHGLTHNFFMAAPLGLLSALTIYLLDKYFNIHKIFYKVFYLAEHSESLLKYVSGGVIGWFLHLFLDAPLYNDMRPFEPLVSSMNPLYLPDTQMLWIVYDLILYSGLLAYSTYFYLRSKDVFGGSLARFQLGILAILMAISLAPIAIDIELLFRDEEAFIPLGVAVSGLLLITISLREMRLISNVRATLILLITIILIIIAFSNMRDLLLSSTVIAAIYFGAAPVIVLLRKPLTQISIEVNKRSVKAVDLLLIGWLSTLLIVGIPVFIASLVILIIKSRDLTKVSSLP